METCLDGDVNYYRREEMAGGICMQSAGEFAGIWMGGLSTNTVLNCESLYEYEKCLIAVGQRLLFEETNRFYNTNEILSIIRTRSFL